MEQLLIDQQTEDTPTGWMREALLPWLGKKDWTTAELLGFLQGYGLPPVGHDEEPYVWLLRGLPSGANRQNAETELAHRVAALLREQPDVNRPGRRPEQALCNLLLLCVGLNAAEILAKPLAELYDRQMKKNTLAGSWIGLSLSARLRDALIENQIDNRFKQLWLEMSKGNSSERLPGHPPHGFSGILWMPKLEGQRGIPDIEAIGEALKSLTVYLESAADRSKRFERFLRRVKDAYPDVSWDLEFLLMCYGNQWPKWTRLEKDESSILSPIANELDELASNRRLPSSSSAVATTVTHVMHDLERKAVRQNKTDRARQYREVRLRFLFSRGMGATTVTKGR